MTDLQQKIEQFREQLKREQKTPETVARNDHGEPKERLASEHTDDLGREKRGRR